MSPELIAPQEFGLRVSRPTRSSDCYSLAMVVYETISGSPPFHEDKDLAVFVKVLKGERPTRGMDFTNRLWKVLEQCWMARPDDRPSIEDVLQCLETCPRLSETASGGIEDEPGSDGGKPVLDKQGDCNPHNRNSPSDDRPPESGSREMETTMDLSTFPPTIGDHDQPWLSSSADNIFSTTFWDDILLPGMSQRNPISSDAYGYVVLSGTSDPLVGLSGGLAYTPGVSGLITPGSGWSPAQPENGDRLPSSPTDKPNTPTASLPPPSFVSTDFPPSENPRNPFIGAPSLSDILGLASGQWLHGAFGRIPPTGQLINTLEGTFASPRSPLPHSANLHHLFHSSTRSDVEHGSGSSKYLIGHPRQP